MDISTAVVDELKRRARVAAANAYAPYSRFAVGAAVLAADGSMYAAANIENASYGLSMCAERNAIFRAVSEGTRNIVAVAVYTPTPNPTPPCGACRQVIAEFGAGALVLCDGADPMASRRYLLGELLPDAFGPGNL